MRGDVGIEPYGGFAILFVSMKMGGWLEDGRAMRAPTGVAMVRGIVIHYIRYKR